LAFRASFAAAARDILVARRRRIGRLNPA